MRKTYDFAESSITCSLDLVLVLPLEMAMSCSSSLGIGGDETTSLYWGRRYLWVKRYLWAKWVKLFFIFFYINVMFCYYKNLPRIRGCASDKRLCLGFKGLREGMLIRSRMQSESWKVVNIWIVALWNGLLAKQESLRSEA